MVFCSVWSLFFLWKHDQIICPIDEFFPLYNQFSNINLNFIWISRFKWTNLSERLAYEKAVHHQRLRTEISQAKREADFFKANVEKSKRMGRKRPRESPESPNPAKRVYDFRQKETDSSIRKSKQQKNSSNNSSSKKTNESSSTFVWISWKIHSPRKRNNNYLVLSFVSLKWWICNGVHIICNNWSFRFGIQNQSSN